MESSPSFLDHLSFFLPRPILAISFVLCFIALWWFLTWKLALSHVPLVQDIFGLKKSFKPKPESRGRFSKFYKKNRNFQDPKQKEVKNKKKILFKNQEVEQEQSRKIQVKKIFRHYQGFVLSCSNVACILCRVEVFQAQILNHFPFLHADPKFL